MHQLAASVATFLQAKTFKPSLPRPNTTPLFQLYDDTNPPLQDSPSPFHLDAWDTLLSHYPGNLRLILTSILQFGALVGYTGPDRYILSKNLISANDAPEVMHDKLMEDLRFRRVVPTFPQYPFISSPLGFQT
jgi:hypothetical protein